MIRKASIEGSDFIGVYCAANDEIAVLTQIASDDVAKIIEKTLGVEVHRTLLGSSPLVGSLMVLNSTGAVITDFASEEDVPFLFNDYNVLFIADEINAVGNDIIANDRAAMIHEEFDRKTEKLIEDVLGVEVVRGRIGGIPTVGSAAVVTNKGMLVHPNVSEEEAKELEEIFHVEVYVGTANFGSPYVGSCIVANSKGAVVGEKTTPIEMGRIEEALRLY